MAWVDSRDDWSRDSLEEMDEAFGAYDGTFGKGLAKA